MFTTIKKLFTTPWSTGIVIPLGKNRKLVIPIGTHFMTREEAYNVAYHGNPYGPKVEKHEEGFYCIRCGEQLSVYCEDCKEAVADGKDYCDGE